VFARAQAEAFLAGYESRYPSRFFPAFLVFAHRCFIRTDMRLRAAGIKPAQTWIGITFHRGHCFSAATSVRLFKTPPKNSYASCWQA